MSRVSNLNLTRAALALTVGIAAASAGTARAATFTYTTVGTLNTNNNVAANATGNPTSSTGGNDVAGFGTAVAAAFAINSGGVVNFDTSNSGITGINAKFGTSGSKTLTITPSVSINAQSFSQSAGSSGANGALPGTSTVVSYDLNFDGITGGVAGEVVQRAGVVVLGRNANGFYPLGVTVTATLGSGGTQPLTASVAAANGTNVFYGFTAPANDGIVKLTLSAPVVNGGTGDQRILIDDVGFVTGVPEPTAAGAAGLAAAGLLARRRRRR